MSIENPLQLLEKESTDDWQTFSFTQNLVQMHNPLPKRIVLKSFCTFSMSKEKITDFLTSNDQLKHAFDSCIEYGQGGPNLIYRIGLPTPLGVSKRVAVVEVMKPDDLSLKQIPLLFKQSNQTVDLDGAIKVEVNYMGFIVEEVSMFLTKFWFLCDIDPRGTLPNAVVEYMKKYMSLIPRKIKDHIKGKASN